MRQPPGVRVFEEHASRYDRWYEAGPGRVLFQMELEAVRLALEGLPRPWLEIGVGTGRFAEALGVEVGMDPARAVLDVFAGRLKDVSLGARLVQGAGEALPFADASFGAALLVVTLCFAGKPARLIEEAARVVRPGGAVVPCIVDRDSPWGRWYLEKQAAGHLFYEHARFFTAREVSAWLERAGLRVFRVTSTLTQPPQESPRPEPAHPCLVAGASFVCLAGRKERLYSLPDS